MRWRPRLYNGPRIDDVRIKRAFALFPEKVGVFKIWLESYYKVEKCWHVHGGFVGPRWHCEYTAFDPQSAAEYVATNYENYTYLKTKNLYRNLKEPIGNSPWQNQSPG
ncbi:MAG TPA: hypothetical protein VMV05_03375 [bacterium]|nr:hypothetical protein [bacterium]